MPVIRSGDIVVGIDPSLGSAAVMLGSINSPIDKLQRRVFKASNPVKGLDRINRWMDHSSNLIQFITSYTSNPVLVLIEGYSYGSQGQAILDLAEFGGVLRYKMRTQTHFPTILEVSPSTLKQFVTGKGNANKTQVIASLSREYKVAFDTNDEYDALGLWLMGRALLAPNSCKREIQRKAVGSLNYNK